MNSPLCLWLAEAEILLWRMTAGVFRFIIHGLAEWIIRTLIEVVGPAVVRLVRFSVALSFWLGVVAGPVVAAIYLIQDETWGLAASGVWLALAMIGSVWGLYYFKKRRATANGLTRQNTQRRMVLTRQ